MQSVARLPKISTNVRTQTAPGRWVRLALQATDAVSTPLAGRLLERIFTTPERHAPSERERATLATARPFSVSSARGRLAAWTLGSGPSVLLVHGWAGRGGQLSELALALVAAGFRVVGFDVIGHGASEGDRSSLVHFRDSVRAMAELAGPFYAVVAHSLGGAASALAMAEAPLFSRAVFLGPPSDLEAHTRRFAGFIGAPPRVRDEMQRRLERRFGVPFSQLRVTGAGPLIPRTPLLVVHDRGDVEVPFADGAEIAAAWPGATLLATEGLGHRRILRDPAVVARAVAFLTAGLARCATPDCPRIVDGSFDVTHCPTCAVEADLRKSL